MMLARPHGKHWRRGPVRLQAWTGVSQCSCQRVPTWSIQATW